MKLKQLSKTIQDIHQAFSKQAGRSVNMALTLRNWFIGYYIKEYEQDGQDRAEYGAITIKQVANTLQKHKIPATAYTSLKQYRQFYEAYPQIGQTASGQSNPLNSQANSDDDIPVLPPDKLIHNLSYSHFVELIKIDEPLKRSFYEIESIRSNWDHYIQIKITNG